MRRGRLSLRARWRSFARDRAGNIAQMFAFALVPLLATTGIVVDYSRVSAIRSKLDSAADSAVLAAVSLNAKPFVARACRRRLACASCSMPSRRASRASPSRIPRQHRLGRRHDDRHGELCRDGSHRRRGMIG